MISFSKGFTFLYYPLYPQRSQKPSLLTFLGMSKIKSSFEFGPTRWKWLRQLSEWHWNIIRSQLQYWGNFDNGHALGLLFPSFRKNSVWYLVGCICRINNGRCYREFFVYLFWGFGLFLRVLSFFQETLSTDSTAIWKS